MFNWAPLFLSRTHSRLHRSVAHLLALSLCTLCSFTSLVLPPCSPMPHVLPGFARCQADGSLTIGASCIASDLWGNGLLPSFALWRACLSWLRTMVRAVLGHCVGPFLLLLLLSWSCLGGSPPCARSALCVGVPCWSALCAAASLAEELFLVQLSAVRPGAAAFPSRPLLSVVALAGSRFVPLCCSLL